MKRIKEEIFSLLMENGCSFVRQLGKCRLPDGSDETITSFKDAELWLSLNPENTLGVRLPETTKTKTLIVVDYDHNSSCDILPQIRSMCQSQGLTFLVDKTIRGFHLYFTVSGFQKPQANPSRARMGIPLEYFVNRVVTCYDPELVIGSKHEAPFSGLPDFLEPLRKRVSAQINSPFEVVKDSGCSWVPEGCRNITLYNWSLVSGLKARELQKMWVKDPLSDSEIQNIETSVNKSQLKSQTNNTSAKRGRPRLQRSLTPAMPVMEQEIEVLRWEDLDPIEHIRNFMTKSNDHTCPLALTYCAQLIAHNSFKLKGRLGYEPFIPEWIFTENGVTTSITEEMAKGKVIESFTKHGIIATLSFLSYLFLYLRRTLETRDTTSDGILFNNGYVPYGTSDLQNPPDGMIFRHRIQCDFVKDSPLAPETCEWLDEVCGDSQYLRQAIRLLLCHLFGGLKNFDIQLLYYVIGPGGTGKSALLNLLKEIVGREQYFGLSPNQVKSRFTEGIIIQKGRVAAYSDIHYKSLYDIDFQATLKVLTGNESRSKEVRYVNWITHGTKVVTFKGVVIVTSNYRLASFTDSGLKRRILTMPFLRIPSKRVPFIHKRLIKDVSGLYNWAMGLDEEIKRDPIKALQELDPTFITEDPMVTWIETRLVFSPELFTPTIVLKEDCMAYYESLGEDTKLKLNVFSDQLESEFAKMSSGVALLAERHRTNTARGFKGVGLRKPDVEEPKPFGFITSAE